MTKADDDFIETIPFLGLGINVESMVVTLATIPHLQVDAMENCVITIPCRISEVDGVLTKHNHLEFSY